MTGNNKAITRLYISGFTIAAVEYNSRFPAIVHVCEIA